MTRNIWKKGSSGAPRLSRTLATAFFSVSAVVLLLYGSVEMFSAFRNQQTFISAKQQLIAQDAAKMVGNFINENFSILETTIWLTDLATAPDGKQSLILQSLLGIRSAFRQLVLLNGQNRILARSSRLSMDASSRIAGMLDDIGPGQDPARKRKTGPVRIDPVTNEPLTTISVPVTDVFGDFKGTLCAEINLKSMFDVVDQLKVGKTGYVYVSDRRGNLLAYYDAARVLRGENVSRLKAVADFIRNDDSVIPQTATTYRGIKGSTVVGIYVPLKTPDWAVVTELPWKEAYWGTFQNIARSVGITLVAAIVAGIFGIFMARRLLLPVTGLTETATRIAAGEREQQAAVGGPREVADLAIAFNVMTAQLRQSLEDLEHRFADLKQAEEALSLSEERLRLALDGTSDGIWDWNVQTGRTYFSPRYYTMMGYEPDEFPASYESWRRLLHPDDVEPSERAIRGAIDDNSRYSVEFRFRAKDGDWRWILGRGKVVEFDPAGKSVRVAGSHTDITERKRAEIALLESEQKFRMVVENAQPIIFILDEKGVFQLSEGKGLAKLGLQPGEVVGESAFERYKEVPSILEGIKLALEGKSNNRIDVVGDVVFETVYSPYYTMGGRQNGIVGIAIDITERRRVEEALEKRVMALTQPLNAAEGIAFEDLFDLSDIQHLQDLYSEAFGVAALMTRPDGTPITEPSNFTSLCSEIIRKTSTGERNCNYSDSTIGRHNPSGPNIQPCLSAGLSNAGASITVGGRHVANWLIGQVRNDAQTEEEITKYAREIGADETAFRAAYRKVPIMSHGQFEKVANVLFAMASQISRTAYQNIQQARFISERKRAEESLRKYERIVSTSQDLMALISRDYIYETVNDSVMKAHSVSREEIVGRSLSEMFGERFFREKIQPRFDQALSGKTLNFQERFEYRNSAWVMLDITYFPVFDDKGKVEGVVVHARDITETRRLEEKLIQSQKMEAIGILAGGVAHEINNPINGIMNYAQLIIDRSKEEGPAREMAKEIIFETERIAGIVRNLLTFARHEKQSHSPARMADIVASVLSLIRTVMRHDQIDLQVDVPDDLPAIKCRSQQIQQVLMNLMTNARDALNQKYPQYNAEKQLRVFARLIHKENKPFIRVTVEDLGTGIPPHIRERIFEPFFTTKPKEMGTGLGLSITYGIVKEHHGELIVETEPGRYTRIHMDLPVDNGWKIAGN